MGEDNLWGELPSGDQINSPSLLLHEQGKVLEKLTKGTLAGKVRRGKTKDGKIFAVLQISAPILDHYANDFLRIEYDLEPYPLAVLNLLEKSAVPEECRCESEFRIAVKEILSSDRARRVIAGLLSHSHEEERFRAEYSGST